MSFRQVRSVANSDYYLRRVRSSVCPSVRSSAQMELCSRWTDFPEVWYWRVL